MNNSHPPALSTARTLHIAVLDDYQNVVPTLPSFRLMAGRDITIFNDHVTDVDSLAARLADAEALLLIRERTPITRELLERLPRLRMISQSGAVPHIDLSACAEHGVAVCSLTTPQRPSLATAELTWGLVLAAWRRIPQESANLCEGGWQTPLAVGRVLSGHTLGIYGWGGIGALVGSFGRAFGMHVLAFGREASIERARAEGVEVVSKGEEFFSRCDVLSLHLALNEQTRGIVRPELLDLMKPDALIVNTSRAGLIPEGALVQSLRRGRPGLAAVDVFDREPPGIDEPLLHMENVVATPHLGYSERGSLDAMFTRMFQQVIAYEAGTPMNCVQAM